MSREVKKRVSFRNVKEIKFYEKDVKNCAELLFDGSPVKEKINETLGSDGIFTPGRTMVSTESSHHTSVTTTHMFEETSKQPIPIDPIDNTMDMFDNKENTNCADMTNYDVSDMQISVVEERTLTSRDYTMSNSNENSFEETMMMWENAKRAPIVERGVTSNFNETIGMFPPTEPVLMTVLEEPEKGDSSCPMELTEEIFNVSGANANETITVKTSDTTKISPKVVTVSSDTNSSPCITHTLLSTTAEMFPDNNETIYYQSVAMDISQNPTEEEIPTKLFECSQLKATHIFEDAPNQQTPIDPIDNTMDMFDKKENTTLVDVTNYDVSDMQDADLSLKEEGHSTICLSSAKERSVQTIVISSDKTTNNSLCETSRAVNITSNLSMFARCEEMLINDKTALLELTMNASRISNRSGRASMLSQSIRSRRRSSLNTTLKDIDEMVKNSPVTLDKDMSMEEQLSFLSQAFDNNLFKIKYLEEQNDDLTREIKCNQLDQLIQYLHTQKNKYDDELAQKMEKFKANQPKKAAAVEALNGKNLGVYDADLLVASRSIASCEILAKRMEIAKQFSEQIEKMQPEMSKMLDSAERKALLCEDIPDLEDELVKLQKEWEDLKSTDLNSLQEAEFQNKMKQRRFREFQQEALDLELILLGIENKSIVKKIFIQEEINRLLKQLLTEEKSNESIIRSLLRD